MLLPSAQVQIVSRIMVFCGVFGLLLGELPFPSHAVVLPCQHCIERGDIYITAVVHGTKSSGFWRQVQRAAVTAGHILNIQLEFNLWDLHDTLKMAERIEAVVARTSPPHALLVTIPGANVYDAIKKAVDVGIPVFSLNSGYDVAANLGIKSHFGMHEYNGGLLSGSRFFDTFAARGQVMQHCIAINHEVGNTALDLRRNGFQDFCKTKGVLEVAEVMVSAGNVDAIRQSFKEVLPQYQAAGTLAGAAILTLGDATVATLVAELKLLGVLDQVVVGTFDVGDDAYNALDNDDVIFAIDHQQFLQGVLPVFIATLYVTTGQLMTPEVYMTGPQFVANRPATGHCTCASEAFPVCTCPWAHGNETSVDSSECEAIGESLVEQPKCLPCSDLRQTKLRGIAHGDLSSDFWRTVRGGALQAARDFRLVDFRFDLWQQFDLDAMAKKIENTAEDGSIDGIFVSIPSEAVLPAITKACKSTLVVTINSGHDVSKTLDPGTANLLYHVGQNEYNGGWQAARQLKKAGATHIIVPKHELGNKAMDQRIEGAVDFAKSVEGIGLKVTADPMVSNININSGDAIRMYLSMKLYDDESIDGTLFLNAENLVEALPAIKNISRVIYSGTFDINEEISNAIGSGDVLFAVDQLPYMQGYMAVALLVISKWTGLKLVERTIQSGPSLVTTIDPVRAECLGYKWTEERTGTIFADKFAQAFPTCEYKSSSTVELFLGIIAPITRDKYQLQALLAAWDLDFQKHHDAAVRTRLGPPVVEMPDFPPELRIRPYLSNTDGDSNAAIASALNLILGRDKYSRVHGLVGCHYSSSSLPLAALCATLKQTQISWGSTSSALSDTAAYPFFLRTVPSDIMEARALWKYMQKFSLISVSIIYSAEPYGQGIYENLATFAQTAGQEHVLKRLPPIESDWNYNSTMQTLHALKDSGTHIAVVAVSSILWTSLIVLWSHEISKEYQVLGCSSIANAELMDLLHAGTHAFTPAISTGKVYHKFWEMWTQLTEDDYAGNASVDRWQISSWNSERGIFNQSKFKASWFADPNELPFYSWFFFDALYTYAHAFAKLVRAGVDSELIRGELLLDALKNTSFEGITGRVTFDENGDRSMDYDFKVLHGGKDRMSPSRSGRKWIKVGTYSASSNSLLLNTPEDLLWVSGSQGPQAPANLTACNPGSFLKRGMCVQCAEGTFSSGDSSDACTPCAFGKYSNSMRTDCLNCISPQTAPSCRDTCLTDALLLGTQKVVEQQEALTLSNGLPLGIFFFDWPSAKFVGEVYATLASEVLGLRTHMSGISSTSIVGIWALAGCRHPELYTEVTEGVQNASCQAELSESHLAFEIWDQNNQVEIDQAQELLTAPPIKLGELGYNGVESMFVLGRNFRKALLEERSPLDFYRSYDVTWYRPQDYFDDISAINQTLLKDCQESESEDPPLTIHRDVLMRHYQAFTGDTDGVKEVKGKMQAACDGPWWYSPACRRDARQCIPVISAGPAYFVDSFMHWSAQHNMPLAIATAKTWGQWKKIARDFGTLLYWWGPDTTFLDVHPKEIRFPPHDRRAWVEGDKRTGPANSLLSKWANSRLQSLAPRALDLAKRMKFSITDILSALEHETLHSLNMASVACWWLRSNVDTWSAWIRDPTDCLPGQGMMDESKEFLQKGDIDVEGGRIAESCQFCGQGSRSEETTDTNGTYMYICNPCEPGTFQAQLASTHCEICPGGTTSAGASDSCERCAQGTFSAVGAGECERCPEGRSTTVSGSANRSDCVCLKGTYARDLSIDCERCGSLWTTPVMGAVSADECVPTPRTYVLGTAAIALIVALVVVCIYKARGHIRFQIHMLRLCRALERNEVVLSDFDIKTLHIFIPPMLHLEYKSAQAMDALRAFESHLHRYRRLTPRQNQHFQCLIERAYVYLDAFVDAVANNLELQEQAASLDKQATQVSLPVYGAVLDAKVRTDIDYEPVMRMVANEVEDLISETKSQWCLDQSIERHDMVGLLKGAIDAQQQLHRFLDEIVSLIKSKPMLQDTKSQEEDHNDNFVHTLSPRSEEHRPRRNSIFSEEKYTVGKPKLKSIGRIIEKSALEGDASYRKDLRCIRDVARGSINTTSMTGIKNILKQMVDMHRRKHRIKLLRVKNRFANPTAAGWADLMLNGVFLDDPSKHVWEVQLFHANLSLVRAEMGAHNDYADARSATEITACIHERPRREPRKSTLPSRMLASADSAQPMCDAAVDSPPLVLEGFDFTATDEAYMLPTVSNFMESRHYEGAEHRTAL